MPKQMYIRPEGQRQNQKPGQGVTEAETLIRPEGQWQKPKPGQMENEKKH